MGLRSAGPAAVEQGSKAVRAKRSRKNSSSRRSATEAPPHVQGARDVEESISGDEPDQPEKCLRFVDVLSEIPNGDAASASELILNERGFSEVQSLEACRELRKLELRGSHLDDLGFLEMNHSLCWLGLARNRLSRINHLQNLSSLAVLDLSDNHLTRLEGLSGLSALKALIAARNKIVCVEGLSPNRNPSLETLVLSHNRIAELKLAGFQKLRKLSLAQNKLHAFPGLTNLPELAELRLNGNRMCTLSTDVCMLPQIAILDIGNNLLSSASAIEALRGLRRMKNMNLSGNPVASDMDAPPLKGLLESLQKLEIVNNRRLPSAPHKQKRRAYYTKDVKQAWEGRQASWKATSVHGSDFPGKRSVFADSNEETALGRKHHGAASKQRLASNAEKVSLAAAAAHSDSAPTERVPAGKTKKRRSLQKLSAPIASSGLCESAANTSVKGRPGKKRKRQAEDGTTVPSTAVAKKKKKTRRVSVGLG